MKPAFTKSLEDLEAEYPTLRRLDKEGYTAVRRVNGRGVYSTWLTTIPGTHCHVIAWEPVSGGRIEIAQDVCRLQAPAVNAQLLARF
jgi:hypothetical protein